jgi:hypothetical protein
MAKLRVEWYGRFARNTASASLADAIGLYAVQHDVRNASARIRNIRNPARGVITTGMSKQVSASGAISDPRQRPTSDARGAKLTTLLGSDPPRNAVESKIGSSEDDFELGTP